ncbi:MAG: flagellar hook-length control protein FliK [Pararhodobacter sp.]
MLIQTLGDTAAPAGHRPAPLATAATARTPGSMPGAFGALMTELERQQRPGPAADPRQTDSPGAKTEPAVEDETEGASSDTPEQAASDSAEPDGTSEHETPDFGLISDLDDEAPLATEIAPKGPEASGEGAAKDAISGQDAAAHSTQPGLGGADNAASGAARTGAGAASVATLPGAVGAQGESTPTAVAALGANVAHAIAGDAPPARPFARAGAEPNGQPMQPIDRMAAHHADQGTTPGARIAGASAETGLGAPSANHTPARQAQTGGANGAQPGLTAGPASDSPAQGALSSLAQSVRERIAAQNGRGETPLHGAWASSAGNAAPGGTGIALPAGILPITPATYLPSASLAAVSGDLPRSASGLASLPGATPGAGEAAPLNGFAEILYPAGALPMGDPAAPNAPAGALPAPNSPAAAEMARSIAQQMGAQISADGKGRFEIALSPAELGRVEMVLQDSDNRLTLTVFAERPETMDLIRRNLGLLAQEMRDLGFAGLSLQLGGQGDRPAQGNNARPDLPLAASAPEPGTPATARRLASELASDHLDLRL